MERASDAGMSREESERARILSSSPERASLSGIVISVGPLAPSPSARLSRAPFPILAERASETEGTFSFFHVSDGATTTERTSDSPLHVFNFCAQPPRWCPERASSLIPRVSPGDAEQR